MKLEYLPISQLDMFKRKMPKSKVMEEYEGYIKDLQDGQLGRILVTKKDDVKPATVKTRLVRAAKSLNISIKIKRVGNEVIFWRESALT